MKVEFASRCLGEGCNMDSRTIDTYNVLARGFAAEWEDKQDPPDDLYAVVTSYFRPGLTVDVGCGSGRDTAWLAAKGFNVVGVDASSGLIAEARRRHLNVRFECDTLPELRSLKAGAYANVLCETVIMHMPEAKALESVRRMVELLAPGGALYLSWRVTVGGEWRDERDRLYASFDTHRIAAELKGFTMELDERIVSASSNKIVHRLVVRRGE